MIATQSEARADTSGLIGLDGRDVSDPSRANILAYRVLRSAGLALSPDMDLSTTHFNVKRKAEPSCRLS